MGADADLPFAVPPPRELAEQLLARAWDDCCPDRERVLLEQGALVIQSLLVELARARERDEAMRAWDRRCGAAGGSDVKRGVDMDAERDGGWTLKPGGVAATGLFDSDGRHCTREEADRVQTVLEVFPELIGQRSIPAIAEALKSHGVLEVFPPASQRDEARRANVRRRGAAGGRDGEEC